MKIKWAGWILGVGLSLLSYQAWAENISISTYYPSPYGAYTDLDTVTLDATGAVTADSVTVANGLTAASASIANSATVGSLSSNGAVTAAAAVSGQTVTATGDITSTGGNLSARGMTVAGTGGSGALRVQQVGSDYYCYAVYA